MWSANPTLSLNTSTSLISYIVFVVNTPSVPTVIEVNFKQSINIAQIIHYRHHISFAPFPNSI